MKGCMSTDLGIITIDPEVIAKYAGTVAVECFGIVGMAAVNMKDGLAFDVAEKVRLTVVVPTCGIKALSTSSPSSIITVAIAAAAYIPVPQASPIAAVTHSPAAVVSPRTIFF